MLKDKARWCDVVMLHQNVKRCRTDGGDTMAILGVFGMLVALIAIIAFIVFVVGMIILIRRAYRRVRYG